MYYIYHMAQSLQANQFWNIRYKRKGLLTNSIFRIKCTKFHLNFTTPNLQIYLQGTQQNWFGIFFEFSTFFQEFWKFTAKRIKG